MQVQRYGYRELLLSMYENSSLSQGGSKGSSSMRLFSSLCSDLTGYEKRRHTTKRNDQIYKLKNGIYLSVKDQELIDKKLSDIIGWNCIERRNFADATKNVSFTFEPYC